MTGTTTGGPAEPEAKETTMSYPLHLTRELTSNGRDLEDTLDALQADEFAELEPFWLPGVDLEATEYRSYALSA